MTNNERLKYVYDIVNSVLVNKSFSNIILNEKFKGIDEMDKPFITKLVYGIIENDINLDYIINFFCDKYPPKPIITVLKIGIYMLKYLNDTPDYAVVNNIVEFTKYINKKQLSGFVNAVLKKVAVGEIEYPKDTAKMLHYKYSFETWIVGLLLKQYGAELTEQILCYKPNTDNQIRINNSAKFFSNIEKYFIGQGVEYKPTILKNVFYINNKFLSKLKRHEYTNQSLGSCLICDMLDVKPNTKVLDVCAAPGGKSVYLANSQPSAEIVAMDIHAHRVELIKKYAHRMTAPNIKTVQNDATVFNSDFVNHFDYVLCDVPCSGLGIVYSKPEIKYNRTYEDILALSKLQYEILQNTSKYVKIGGTIMYSTCTILGMENQNVVNKFLENNSNFESVAINLPFKNYMTIGNCIQLIPPKDNIDGFFMAKFYRKK